METCPICRAALNGASAWRRCRADLERVQEIEWLGQSLAGAAMLSLAAGDLYSARQWLRRARAVHATPAVRIRERMLATGSAPTPDVSGDADTARWASRSKSIARRWRFFAGFHPKLLTLTMTCRRGRADLTIRGGLPRLDLCAVQIISCNVWIGAGHRYARRVFVGFHVEEDRDPGIVAACRLVSYKLRRAEAAGCREPEIAAAKLAYSREISGGEPIGGRVSPEGKCRDQRRFRGQTAMVCAACGDGIPFDEWRGDELGSLHIPHPYAVQSSRIEDSTSGDPPRARSRCGRLCFGSRRWSC